MAKNKKKLRPLGELLLDMEPLLFEMTELHELQHGDILYLIKGWLDVHASGSRERYTVDNSSPIFKYGPSQD